MATNDKQQHEENVKRTIRKHFGQRPDLKLFTNPVGTGFVGSDVQMHRTQSGSRALILNPRRIDFGLCVGSSDLIGIRRCVCECGRTSGQFVALEVKTETGKPTPDQLNFLRVVNELGGAAGVVRSVDDVEALFTNGD